MKTLLILLALLAVMTVVSFRFFVVRRKEAIGQAAGARELFVARVAAGIFGILGLSLVALMIYVFYFEQ